MNRKLIITLIILGAVIIGTVGTIVSIKVFNKNEIPSEAKPIDNGNSNEADLGTLRESIYGKKITRIEDFNEEDIKNYVHIIPSRFMGKTFEKFEDSEIVSIIANRYLNEFMQATSSKIKNLVKIHFGIDNYELVPKRYMEDYYSEEIIISRNGDIYTSNLVPKSGGSLTDPFHEYQSMEVIDNTIIAHYTYGHFDENIDIYPRVESVFTLLGNIDIYLKYIDKNLIFEKIIYTEKK